MLTGQPPREFRDGVDPIRVVLDMAALPIRALVAGSPKRLARVIDEALGDNRPIVATAAEFAAALREAI